MVLIGSVSSFVMLGGQTSNNVHEFQKVCLETTLCVYACFIMFYVFVFDEINVVGPKPVYKKVWAGNFRANISNNHPSVLEEGPKLVAKIA